jgi:hypothetical protein
LSFLEEAKPVLLTENAPECIRKEAIASHREKKLESYHDKRALAGQAVLGIKKVISPDLIEEIMVEFKKKPPVPVFRKQRSPKKTQKKHRHRSVPGEEGDLLVTTSYENSFLMAETSDISLEGFSHVSIVRSLHTNNPPETNEVKSPGFRQRGQTVIQPRQCFEDRRNTAISSGAALTVSEKIARRTEILKLESQRVMQMVEEKHARAEEMRLARIAHKKRQDLQKIWLLTVVHMARTRCALCYAL